MKKILLFLICICFIIINFTGCKNEDRAISILVVWGGDELESFKAMVKPFEDSTGIKINIESTRDINAVLTTRVIAGNPPDLATLPNPGVMREFALQEKIIPLEENSFIEKIKSEHGQSWFELGSYDEKLYGIFIKAALKSLVWYNPQAFNAAGYQIPKTFEELQKLTRRIANDGRKPWSIGLESGAASGWPATDWIEDILLINFGTDFYDKWTNHQIAWTHPNIKAAWKIFGDIVLNNQYVYGGKQGVLSTNFGEAVYPLFREKPPESGLTKGSIRLAYLHHQATFIQSFIQQQFPNLKPVQNYSFFQFPGLDPNKPSPIIVAADVLVMLKNKKSNLRLIKYLASATAQEIWVKRGGALAPNKMIEPGFYPDQLSRNAAEILQNATAFRFDASDLMPAEVNNAFSKGALDFVNGKNLNDILNYIEQIASEAYGK
jgi:alpha-glucoside transport system substrate-binding protein